MTYSINARGWIVRDADGAFIPTDPGNADYANYLAWVGDGNAATPYAEPAPTWASFQAQAQTALEETDMVALRCWKATVAFPADWQAYTVALRSIVSAETGTPGDLPVKPAYPPGT